MAFYWRADHGVYVAFGIVLAAYAAHGWRVAALTRCMAGAAMMAALVAPFLVYVQVTIGLPEAIQTGIAAATVEHSTQGPHAWPLLRAGRDTFVTIEPAEIYAPTIAIAWTPESSLDARREVLARYGLSVAESDPDGLDRVKPSEAALKQLRGLLRALARRRRVGYPGG